MAGVSERCLGSGKGFHITHTLKTQGRSGCADADDGGGDGGAGQREPDSPCPVTFNCSKSPGCKGL